MSKICFQNFNVGFAKTSGRKNVLFLKKGKMLLIKRKLQTLLTNGLTES